MGLFDLLAGYFPPPPPPRQHIMGATTRTPKLIATKPAKAYRPKPEKKIARKPKRIAVKPPAAYGINRSMTPTGLLGSEPTNLMDKLDWLKETKGSYDYSKDRKVTSSNDKAIDVLLDNIYKQEGSFEGATKKDGITPKIPFNYYLDSYKKRAFKNKEFIPVPEVRRAVKRGLKGRMKLWENNNHPKFVEDPKVNLNNYRKLINPNPNKKKALVKGKWDKNFIRWYGELYAPKDADPDNEHWVPNIMSFLGEDNLLKE